MRLLLGRLKAVPIQLCLNRTRMRVLESPRMDSGQARLLVRRARKTSERARA